ncbi:winged helix-turn-helix transcriptional regulator [Candidatus Bathyarchaeota archaeon]|nr:winged helix-turn-helix transcriptional regulator [Candidatus Bathyarchaeota archaeon]
MGKIGEIEPEELRLTEVFRALGEVKRFLIFKNLRVGPCYADELVELLGISRPALGKHMRVLIDAGLARLKYTIEDGKTKARLELTDISSKMATLVDEMVSGIIKDILSREKTLKAELVEAEIQYVSTKATLESLEKKHKEGSISEEEYVRLRTLYEGQLKRLSDKLTKLQHLITV